MPRVVAYHRPDSIEHAIQLLQRAGVETYALAGGTKLNAHYQDADVTPIEVVDLQALALEGLDLDRTVLDNHSAHAHAIGGTESVLHIGAMTTLGALAGSSMVPALLRELATSELPNTLRNMATVGGTVIAAERESALLAGLLALRAGVEFTNGSETVTVPLASFLTDAALMASTHRTHIITAVHVHSPLAWAHEGVGRTPADTPIVAVVAARHPDGVTLAASGVASHPIVITEDQQVSPPGDFRGSPEYRQDLLRTLTTRVLHAIGAGS